MLIEATTIGDLVDRAASMSDGDAVVFPDVRVTYPELSVLTNRFARSLRALGVGPGDKVGILMSDCLDFAVGLIGIAKLGAVSVPINGRFKAHELDHVISHADVRVLLTAAGPEGTVDYPALLAEVFPAIDEQDPGMEIKIIDPETGAERPPGEVGELCFRGYARFEGYYKDPDLTAASIDDEGWFHSGDLGVVDEEGRFKYTGRLKDMLKVGGENVSALEVEDYLLRHEAVSIVQVVSAPDSRYVEVPAAFVQLRPGASATEEELIDFCVGKIATFKVPRYVRFVEEWPMSGTKIQKFVLRERIARELEEKGIGEAPKIGWRARAGA